MAFPLEYVLPLIVAFFRGIMTTPGYISIAGKLIAAELDVIHTSISAAWQEVFISAQRQTFSPKEVIWSLVWQLKICVICTCIKNPGGNIVSTEMFLKTHEMYSWMMTQESLYRGGGEEEENVQPGY